MSETAFNSAIDRLRASLPQSEIDLTKVMDRVSDVYIETDLDDLLRTQFNRLLRTITSGKPLLLSDREADRKETRGIVLVGEAGAGKTSSLDHLFQNHPALKGYGQVGSGCPLVTVSVEAPCTLKSLGTSILRKIGYPSVREREANEVWARVRRMLVEEGVLILHFDETHNLTDVADIKQIGIIRKTFKSLMVSPTWPVGLVFSGLPSLVPALREIKELRRRGRFMQVPLLDMPADIPLINGALTACCEVAGIALPEGFADLIGPRLSHAADRSFGIAAEFIHEAIEECLQAGEDCLAVEHFAAAYTGRSGNGARMNVFVAPDWIDIDPTQVLLNEMPQEAVLPDEPARRPRTSRKGRN
jgi:hypothetical protein